MKTIIALIILLIPTLAQAQLADLIKAAAEKQAEQFEALKKSNTENFEPITGAFGVKLGQHISEVDPELKVSFVNDESIFLRNHTFNPKKEHQLDGDVFYVLREDTLSGRVIQIAFGLSTENCTNDLEVFEYILSNKYGKSMIIQGKKHAIPKEGYSVVLTCQEEGMLSIAYFDHDEKITKQSKKQYLETASAELKSSGL
jgi:hypothetical protein